MLCSATWSRSRRNSTGFSFDELAPASEQPAGGVDHDRVRPRRGFARGALRRIFHSSVAGRHYADRDFDTGITAFLGGQLLVALPGHNRGLATMASIQLVFPGRNHLG